MCVSCLAIYLNVVLNLASFVLDVTLFFIELVHSIHGTYKIQYHPNGAEEGPVYEVSLCILSVTFSFHYIISEVIWWDRMLLIGELNGLTIFKILKLWFLHKFMFIFSAMRVVKIRLIANDFIS